MRVLLPVDTDEERAVAAAEAVRSLPNAEEDVYVTVLNVQKKVEVAGDAGGAVSSEEWYDEGSTPLSVKKVVELLREDGISVETRREHADPAEAIITVADEAEADRIVMATRKRTPVGKALFGSVTQSVVLDAETPVTIVSK